MPYLFTIFVIFCHNMKTVVLSVINTVRFIKLLYSPETVFIVTYSDCIIESRQL